MKYMVRILTFGWKFWLSKNSWTDFLSIPLKGAIFMNFHCFWGAYLSFFSTWFAFCFKLVSRMSTIWQLSEAKFIFAAWFGSIYNGNSLPDIFIRSNQPTQMLCDGIWRDFMASQELFPVAFGDSQRQYLGVIDKSKLSLGKLCCTIFGLAKAGPMVEL